MSVFVLIAMQTAAAAKPGNTGSTSTASLGISLTVPTSVRARPLRSSKALNKSDNYLCVNAQNPQGFRYFLYRVNESVASVVKQPLHVRENSFAVSDCGLTLNIDVSQTQNSAIPLLLMVSPE